MINTLGDSPELASVDINTAECFIQMSIKGRGKRESCIVLSRARYASRELQRATSLSLSLRRVSERNFAEIAHARLLL